MDFRNGWLLTVSAAASVLMACAHGPEGYRAPGAKPDGLLMVKTDDAVKSGLPEWSLAMPLGEKEDESVLEFLAWAEAAGARYVSDVSVVFAARKDKQVMACRMRLQPVVVVDRGPRPAMVAASRAPVTLASASPPTGVSRYTNGPAADLASPATMSSLRRWMLQKSAPECTPVEGGMQALAGRFLRVEGRAYGCGDASASGCEDKVL